MSSADRSTTQPSAPNPVDAEDARLQAVIAANLRLFRAQRGMTPSSWRAFRRFGAAFWRASKAATATSPGASGQLARAVNQPSPT